MATERLDVLLVRRGFFPSREKAQRAIMAGEVILPSRPSVKAGDRVDPDVDVEVRVRDRYVGRGGLKLEAALQHFQIDPTGKVCLDAGASTGGFTDCLLQHGAARVHAFDVGHGQLDWKLRNDPRVVVREKFNLRHLQPEDVGEPIELCVADVSFISLTLILPPIFALLTGEAVVLIKPQFELSPEDVGKGGIVRDPEAHLRAVEKIRGFAEGPLSAKWAGVIESPILGAEGNKEFLAWLKK